MGQHRRKMLQHLLYEFRRVLSGAEAGRQDLPVDQVDREVEHRRRIAKSQISGRRSG
ncbi:Uncharacterised protein [Mycobacteroides abscessus subsp. abscessus]|nr:Uncharacterised protein [Mycobacteroides abscessus subsp. abscessus]